MLFIVCLALALTSHTTLSATARIDPFSIMHTVPKEYVSFNMDQAQRQNYSDPILRLLAASLAPAHIRVGGTGADYQIYFADDGVSCDTLPAPMTDYRCELVKESDWTSLLEFTEASNLTLIYGLNDMYGRPTKTKSDQPLCSATSCPPRNQSNLEALLRWTAEHAPHAPIYGWELGNELNTCLNGAAGAKAQADDFAALKRLVTELWPTNTPLLIGPDTHSATEFSSSGLAWFGTFVKEAQTNVDALTFHMYSMGSGETLTVDGFLNPTALDKSREGALALAAEVAKQGSKTPIWGGETAAANGGGKGGITDTFIDGFWYLDQLGAHAAVGVQGFQRQVFTNTHGSCEYPLIKYDKVLPDYWIAILHKQLMGQRVLNVTSDTRDVRVYAHCANSLRFEAGSVAVAWINLANHTALNITGLPNQDETEEVQITQWALQSGTPIANATDSLQSQEALLNGVKLQLQSDSQGHPVLPPLSGVRTTGALELPAKSYGFAVLDVKAHACL